MIPHIEKGSRFAGLMIYLQGEGRKREHRDQHVIGASANLAGFAVTGDLDKARAVRLAEILDEPRIAFGVDTNVFHRKEAAAKIEAGVPAAVAVQQATRPQHVWHCSLALRADEGQLSDEKWNAIAQDFMREMGFDNDQLAASRWLAVRHGLSANGNDHIHIVASIVRDDGSKVNIKGDFARAQKSCGALERKYGLNVLESRGRAMGDRSLSAAEVYRDEDYSRTHPGADVESPRHNIERRIRAAAIASATEAEFVRRCRADGLRVRPYFDKGSTTTVAGYSVLVPVRSSRSDVSTKAFWCGGGKLAKDLTLPRLRDDWENTPAARAEAEAEWANSTGKAATKPSNRETKILDPAAMSIAAREVGKWNTYLATIPLDDHAQWARAASRSAAMFAAWSTHLAPNEKAFREAARVLRSAAATQSHTRFRPDTENSPMSGSGVGSILLQASLHDPTAASTLLLDQLMRTARAVAAAQRAVGDAARAIEMEQMVEQRLQQVHAGYPPLTAEAETMLVGQYRQMTSKPVAPERLAQIREAGRRLAEGIDDSALHPSGHGLER